MLGQRAMAFAVLLNVLVLTRGYAPTLPAYRLAAFRPAAATMVLDLEKEDPLPRAANVQPTMEDETVGDRNVRDVSYAEQFNDIFSDGTNFDGIRTSKPVPKPSNEAQRRELDSKRIPFSSVWGTLMRPTFGRKWDTTDYGRAIFFGYNHVVGLFAPLCFFSWRLLGLHFLLYCASAMGITYSFHRQVRSATHQSPHSASPTVHLSVSFLTRRAPPVAAGAPLVSVAQVARVHGGLLRLHGHAGRPDRVGVRPPLPPLAHGDSARPALVIRGLLLVASRVDARRKGVCRL